MSNYETVQDSLSSLAAKVYYNGHVQNEDLQPILLQIKEFACGIWEEINERLACAQQHSLNFLASTKPFLSQASGSALEGVMNIFNFLKTILQTLRDRIFN